MASTDPVMWVKSDHKGAFRSPRVWDEQKSRYVRPVDEMGRPRRERVPATGFVGRDLTNMKPMPGKRSAVFLTKAGNTIDVVLSSGASIAARDDEFKADRLRKMRYLGALPVGCCPVREVFRGMSREHIVSAEVREACAGRPCEEHEIGVDEDGQPLPPCPHFLAEQRARRAAQSFDDGKLRMAYKDDAAKQTEALSTLVEHLIAKDAKPAGDPLPPPSPTAKGKDAK